MDCVPAGKQREGKGVPVKLIVCKLCGDVVALRVKKLRSCECGMSWGEYMEDGLHAEIGGQAIAIGFANWSFEKAITDIPVKDGPNAGKRFTAFSIPLECDTVRRKHGVLRGATKKPKPKHSPHTLQLGCCQDKDQDD